MMNRHLDVFLYGLFMDAGALHGKGLHPINVRQASVSGMSLRLGDRATLIPDPGACVYGMLMGLSHAELDQLYAEPSVRAYRPEAVIAKLADGSCVPALCFNLPVPPEADRTNPEYAEKLQAVARRLGLPKNYVASIR
jgi:hypothetical protein